MYCVDCERVSIATKPGAVYKLLPRGPGCPKSHARRFRLFIPPTSNKLAYAPITNESGDAVFKDLLHSVWDHAYSALWSCKRVTFIGYSLPALDAEFRLMITDALRLNEDLEEVRVVTTSKTATERKEFRARYRRVVPTGMRLRMTEAGFVDWLAGKARWTSA